VWSELSSSLLLARFAWSTTRHNQCGYSSPHGTYCGIDDFALLVLPLKPLQRQWCRWFVMTVAPERGLQQIRASKLLPFATINAVRRLALCFMSRTFRARLFSVRRTCIQTDGVCGFPHSLKKMLGLCLSMSHDHARFTTLKQPPLFPPSCWDSTLK
jgi:hypothetical protein